MKLDFVYNDGGRSKYFKAENVGDCVTRAICNATGKDYLEVYNALKELASHERITKRHHRKSSVRNGTYPRTMEKYIDKVLGWRWVPCSGIGMVERTHMLKDELPSGTIIVRLSKHLSCVKDGVIYDTYDCSREGTRMVYGYWIK